MDLSLGGGLIVLEKPRNTSVGATLELAFTVNQLPFRLRAQVRAVRSPTELGLCFESVSERAKSHLEDLIAELEASNLKRKQVAG